MIIHVAPFATFATGDALDLVPRIEKATVMPLPPGRTTMTNEYFVNLDGFVTYTQDREGMSHAYCQAFRSGALEGLQVLSEDESGPILLDYFEEKVVTTIRNYVQVTEYLALGYPLFVMLSFVAMKGCRMKMTGEYDKGTLSAPIRQDVILLPEVMLPDATADIPGAMRLAFNTVWNGFGHRRSPSYDENGNWRLKA